MERRRTKRLPAGISLGGARRRLLMFGMAAVTALNASAADFKFESVFARLASRSACTIWQRTPLAAATISWRSGATVNGA